MKRTTALGSSMLLMGALVTTNTASPGETASVVRAAMLVGGLSLGVFGVGLLSGCIESTVPDEELGRTATVLTATLLAVGTLSLCVLLAFRVGGIV